MKKIIQLRQQVLVWLTHKVGMPYFRLMRKPTNFPYAIADLEQFPSASVGQHLHHFLTHHNLDLLPYYEKHDIKHVLLGYPPTESGEVCLQCFMWANGRRTLPVLIAVMFGWLTMPEYWTDFRAAFKRGRANKSLQGVSWFDLLPFSLAAIQRILIQPKNQTINSLFN